MVTRRLTALTLWALVLLAANSTVFAQSGLVGTVCDETGAALPGVSVQLRAETWIREAITDAQGNYRFAAAPPGPLRLTFALINFAGVRRDIEIPSTVGLYHTAARHRLGAVREGSVVQTSAAVYFKSEMAWMPCCERSPAFA